MPQSSKTVASNHRNGFLYERSCLETAPLRLDAEIWFVDNLTPFANDEPSYIDID
jgi:hypothetical protein